MGLKTNKKNNILIIYLSGRLDIHASTEIEDAVCSLIRENPENHILFNTKEVEHISSSALRVFVSITRLLKESNLNLKFAEMSNEALRLFHVLELMDIFEIYKTEEDALISFHEVLV